MLPNRTLVLGAGGFLGSYISAATSSDSVLHVSPRTIASPNSNLFVLEIKQNSLEDLKKYILQKEFACVVNCVAAANIEECEQSPDRANFLNAELPKLLAEVTKELDAQFVHFSTDAVFDGSVSLKKESDTALPRTVYGQSKLRGEELVTLFNSNALIARINFFGLSKNKSSLFNYFYFGLKERRSLQGYSNIYFSPLYVEETVESVQRLLLMNQSGLVHIAGRERISKFEFGRRIANVWGFEESLITPSDYESEIDRALDLSLDTSKLLSLGIEVPSLSESLIRMRNTYDWSN